MKTKDVSPVIVNEGKAISSWGALSVLNNENMSSFSRKFAWFTLVELIVVITILVILGTIAFMNLSGYSGNARDSSRVSDLTNLSKGLDIAYIKTSSYPTPDNPFTVTYSGWTIWTQGTIGDTVMNIIGTNGAKMNKKPTDPLNQTKEYTYSKLAYGNAYQIKTDWEGDSVAYQEIPKTFWIDQSYAASGNPLLSYIKGNYNGVVAKTQTGSTIYVLAIPSLFLTAGTGTMILSITSSTGFSLHGQTNSGGTLFQPNVVFSSGALPSTDPERQTLATNIANTYSGTILANNPNIQPFISALSPINTGSLVSLGGYAVVNWLGGGAGVIQTSPMVVSSKFPGEDGVSGTSDDCNMDNIKIWTGTATEQIWSARNLGATIAFNGSNAGVYNTSPSATRGGADTVNGKLYQWGRNKWFASTDTSQLSTQLTSDPNANDTYNFIWNATLTNNDWLSPQINTIWGGSTSDSATVDGQTNDVLRKGPCPSGWHIPSAKEWQDACNTIISGTCTSGMTNTSVRTTLVLPYAGDRYWNDGKYYNQNINGYYWSSSPTSTNNGFSLLFSSTNAWPTNNFSRADGFSVRCLKN